jgi:hypothetical protein
LIAALEHHIPLGLGGSRQPVPLAATGLKAFAWPQDPAPLATVHGGGHRLAQIHVQPGGQQGGVRAGVEQTQRR